MTMRIRTKGLLIAGACTALGAAGGIVGSMAAPAKHRHSTATTSTPPPAGRHGPGGFRGAGGPAVHADEVVLNKAGTAFITRTDDAGKVKSVSGSDVTITEGTATVTYKDVTITVPSGATIVRDGATATVGDLKAGDFVHVSQSSDGTDLFAADAAWRPSRGPWGHGPGGPGRDGPPPADGQPN
jgi:hypothetical protein